MTRYYLVELLKFILQRERKFQPEILVPSRVSHKRLSVKKGFYFLSICLSLILLQAIDAIGATRTWDGGAGTAVYTDDANWSGDTEPGSADSAVIGTGYNVTLGSSVSVLQLYIAVGAKLTTNSANAVITVGSGGTSGGLTLDGTIESSSNNCRVDLAGYYIAGQGQYSANSNGCELQLTVNINVIAGSALTINANGAGNATFDLQSFDVTNYGSVAVGPNTPMSGSAGAAWINATNSTLIYNDDADWDTDIALTATAAGNTVHFNNTGTAGTVRMPDPVSDTFCNLTFSGTSNIYTSQDNVTVTGNLTLNSGTFDMDAGNDNLILSGTSMGIYNNGGTFDGDLQTTTISGTITYVGPTTTAFNNVTISNTLTLTSGTTMNVNGNWANNGTFTHGSGTIAFTGTSTLSGTSTSSFYGLTITGTLTGVSAGTFNVSGTWINSGTYTHNSGTVVFNGASQQTFTGASSTTFNNWTISNASGVSLAADPTVAGTLALGANIITTNSSKVIMSNGAAITRTSGYINGKLQKYIASASTNYDFELGSSSNYTPLRVNYSTVTTPGSIIASAYTNDSPDIYASLIDPNKSLNRYWTVTNSSLTASANVTMTLTYPASEIDGSATVAEMEMKRFDGTDWYSTATPTSVSSTSAVVTFTNAYGDFQLGEEYDPRLVYNARGNTTIQWNDQTDWIQYRTGTITTSTGSTTVTGASTLFTSELAAGDVLVSQAAPSTVIGTVSSIGGDGTLTLTGVAASNNTNISWGKQKAPTAATTDMVTIWETNVTAGAVTVDVNTAATCFSLTINSTANGHTVSHSGTNSLTATQNITIRQPGADSRTNTWAIGAGSATVGGNVYIGSANTTATRDAYVTLSTGTLTVGTNIVFNGGAALTSYLTTSGAATINLAGELVLTNATTFYGECQLGGGTSTFNYNGTAAQTINLTTTGNDVTYYNLTVNNSSASGVTLGAASSSTLITNNFSIGNTTASIVKTGTGATTDIDGGGTFRLYAGSSLYLYGTDVDNLPNFATETYDATSNLYFSHSVDGADISGLFGDLGNVYVHPTANNVDFDIVSNPNINGNLVVGDGVITGVTISQSSIDVAGNITVNTGAIVSTTDIEIGGNWANYGTYTHGNKYLQFDGTAAQTIYTSGGTELINNLYIYNTFATSPQVTLLSHVNCRNNLGLFDGTLELGNYNLDMISGGSNSILKGTPGASSGINSNEVLTSWVSTSGTGTLAIAGVGGGTGTYFEFPVGSTAVPLMAVIANGGTSDKYYVRVNSGVLMEGTAGAAVTTKVVGHTWHISELNAGGSTVKLRLHWPTSQEFTSFDRTLCWISHYDASISDWERAGGQTANTTDGSSGTQYYRESPATLDEFSPYIVQSGEGLLPIELLSFDGVLKGNRTDLSWVTASEVNNDFFTIERSLDGENFEPVTDVPGAGNSVVTKRYTAADFEPYQGISYYRLKQTDYDGTTSYSTMIAVDNNELKKFEFSVFPNPSDGQNIYLSAERMDEGEKEVLVVMYDALGKEVYSKVIVSNNGKFYMAIDPSEKLVPGVYFVIGSSDNAVYKQKLIIK